MRLSVPSPRSDKRRAGLTGRLVDCRNAELQLLLAAFFENAQNVARIAQVEARQRLEERENAVHLACLRA